MKLANAIRLIRGDSTHIDPALLERDVDSFVIDSREVKAGDVFFALSQPEYRDNGFNGDFDDATVFVPAAFEAGAIVSVARPDRVEEHSEALSDVKDRIVLVGDAIAAFQALAHGVYLDWNKPVVAITGSAGKTTAKELTAHVLASSGKKVLRNIKNYNNGLGHPLTVLNLAKDDSYDLAVLEMGMSTPLHEIERLCRITPPDVAVVLNVLPVHIEHLGTIERIAQAKAEIVEGMKRGGVAVLNADDHRVAAMASLSKGEVLTFGIENDADVRAVDISGGSLGGCTFTLVIGDMDAKVRFPLDGRHNVMNALAAAAVGHAHGMSAEEIASALTSAAAPPQRGEVLHFAAGFTLINDSYNSNPDALVSMVRTLKDAAPAGGRTVVVAGEMLELGPDAAAVHERTGTEIGPMVNIVIGVRGNAEHLITGVRSASAAEAEFAADSDSAGERLCEIVRPGDAILIKGSRGVRTERVIEKLLEKYQLEGGEAARAT